MQETHAVRKRGAHQTKPPSTSVCGPAYEQCPPTHLVEAAPRQLQQALHDALVQQPRPLCLHDRDEVRLPHDRIVQDLRGRNICAPVLPIPGACG